MWGSGLQPTYSLKGSQPEGEASTEDSRAQGTENGAQRHDLSLWIKPHPKPTLCLDFQRCEVMNPPSCASQLELYLILFRVKSFSTGSLFFVGKGTNNFLHTNVGDWVICYPLLVSFVCAIVIMTFKIEIHDSNYPLCIDVEAYARKNKWFDQGLKLVRLDLHPLSFDTRAYVCLSPHTLYLSLRVEEHVGPQRISASYLSTRKKLKVRFSPSWL